MLPVRRLSSSALPRAAAGFSRAFSSSNQTVLLEQGVNWRLLRLNREKALNAANLDMIRELTVLFDRLEGNQSVHAMVLASQGNRAFCAGGDIKALYENGQSDTDRVETFRFFEEEYQLNYKLATSATPVISYLDGIVMGGGVGLSLPGQYRICTENTVFAMPETAIGFFPDVGGSFYLPRMCSAGAGVGTWLGLTGARLKGFDAHVAGVTTHYLPAEGALDGVLESISMAWDHDVAEETVFQALREGLSIGGDTWFSDHVEHINNVFSADTVEEIIARLNEDDSDWAKESLKKLRAVSPISVKLTFELLRRGAKLSIADALKMEFRAAQHVMEGNDFFEGVKSVLVDRNHVPQWQHKSIEDVTQDELDAYFQLPTGSDNYELELPTERGDSIAYPPEGVPSRLDIVRALWLDQPGQWQAIMDDMDNIQDEIDTLRTFELDDESKQQQQAAEEVSINADADKPKDEVLRDEILRFKQQKADQE